MMAIQNRLRIKPTLAISSCFTLPVANTIAFGGVAIGSINAQLAPQAIIAAKAIEIGRASCRERVYVLV